MVNMYWETWGHSQIQAVKKKEDNIDMRSYH